MGRLPGELAHREAESVGRGEHHSIAIDLDPDAGQHRQRVVATGCHRHLPDGLGELVGRHGPVCSGN